MKLNKTEWHVPVLFVWVVVKQRSLLIESLIFPPGNTTWTAAPPVRMYPWTCTLDSLTWTFPASLGMEIFPRFVAYISFLTVGNCAYVLSVPLSVFLSYQRERPCLPSPSFIHVHVFFLALFNWPQSSLIKGQCCLDNCNSTCPVPVKTCH